MYEAKCDRCKFTQRIADGGLRSYQLPGDVRVTIRQQFAWCQSCHVVVHAERLPTIDQIKAELEAFEQLARDDRGSFAMPGRLAEDEINRERNQLQTLRQVVEGRKSPERCLECGSTDLILIPMADEDDDEIVPMSPCGTVHPGCGGFLSIGGIGFSRSRAWTFYTTEGERIRAYEVLPVKGLVPLDERNGSKGDST